MGTVAKWNGKSFVVNSKKITPITGFSTSYSLVNDANEDADGDTKMNSRGRGPEKPSFAVKYLAAAGVNPRTEFTNWRAMVGKVDWLYIGSTMYGVNKFKLENAAVSDVLLDGKGRTLQAVVTLTFIEVKTKAKKPTSSIKTSSKVKASTKKKSTVTTTKKNQAKKASASKNDKKLKNPYGTNRKK